jgi:hypothetical protein
LASGFIIGAPQHRPLEISVGAIAAMREPVAVRFELQSFRAEAYPSTIIKYLE